MTFQDLSDVKSINPQDVNSNNFQFWQYHVFFTMLII